MAKKRKSKVISVGTGGSGIGTAARVAGGAVGGAGLTLLLQWLLDWIFGSRNDPNLGAQLGLTRVLTSPHPVGPQGTYRNPPVGDRGPGGPALEYPTGGWGEAPDWDPTFTPERAASWEARGPGMLDWAREHTGPGTSEVPGEQYY